MTRFLLDTCALSEMIAMSPTHSFERWMKSVDPSDAAVSVVTVAELRFGLMRLPEGRRREALAVSIDRLLTRLLVLPLSRRAAELAGECLVKAEREGRPMSFTDAAIAATALTEGLRLVTRDADFEVLGMETLNPWKG